MLETLKEPFVLTVDIGNVVRWSRLNRMLINFTKTTYMLLCSRQKDRDYLAQGLPLSLI